MSHELYRNLLPAALFLCLAAPPAMAGPVTLENDRLRVGVLPGSGGMITSIYDKLRGFEHLHPLKEEEDRSSPLVPPQFRSNDAGVRDWFWQMRNPGKIGFQVVGQGDGEDGPWVEVAGKINGIEVLRRMTLLKSHPAVRVDLTLGSPEKQAVSYWSHTIVAEGAYLDPQTRGGWVAGEFSPDISPRQGRSILKVPQAGLQKVETRFGDNALAPDGPWFARLAEPKDTALVLLPDGQFPGKDGFFYTWQDSVQGLATLEAVWPPMEIGPGKEVRFSFYLVVADSADPAKIAGQMKDFSAGQPQP